MKNLFVTFIFLLSFAAYAQVPNVFTSGTVISSSQMNANFTYFDTQFWVRNTGNLVFTTGNVGIGTAAPSYQLEIQNINGHTIFGQRTYSSTSSDTSMINLIKSRGTDASPVALLSGDQIGQIRFSGEVGSGPNPVATLEAYATGSFSGSSSPSALIFKTTPVGSTTATERLRITEAGNVGIGTAAPLNMLHVKNGTGDAAIRVETTSGPGSAKVILKNGTSEFSSSVTGNYWTLNEGGTERLRLDSFGRLGIGTSSPVSHLHVAGDIQADGFVTITNDLTVNGTVYTPSDASLKKNIEIISNPVEKIMALKGVSYDWKDSKKYGKRHQIGVIAQDVKEVFPEAVKERKDGMITVSYPLLVAPLIEAVKSLNVRLESVESENAVLKAYLCNKDPSAPFCSSER